MNTLKISNLEKAREQMRVLLDEKGKLLSTKDIFRKVNKKYEILFGWKK